MSKTAVYPISTKSESPSFRSSLTTSESGNTSPKPSRRGYAYFAPVEHAMQLDLIGKEEFCTNWCEIKPV
ncbi:pentatricopeptide repeat-containing protein [Pyrus ussuriensis x Pyrus communis]|uniref:Pentatricopeptide repeat-containing protein n=1 Tax=Pyrus ussuriensis x Pyrus communis TaxID=2448454 RepID=A0A5N5FE80_9ROSA|nr:pentatricopeptide repeat-containing protein [Pyrus ussuriensis x Pyrus communis]